MTDESVVSAIHEVRDLLQRADERQAEVMAMQRRMFRWVLVVAVLVLLATLWPYIWVQVVRLTSW